MSTPLVSYAFAREFGVFDAGEANGVLNVIFRQGGDLGALSELRRVAALPVDLQVLPADKYQEKLTLIFGEGGARAANMVDDIAEIADLSDLIEDMPRLEDLLDAEEDAPVIRLINALLAEALRQGASDLHFEMFEARAIVRFRIDGRTKQA